MATCGPIPIHVTIHISVKAEKRADDLGRVIVEAMKAYRDR